MDLQNELKAFYARCGFGEIPGKRPRYVKVYTGCILVPLPNIETRRIYLKYHDLHHLVTGYSVGRIGEGKVSAWELGTGSVFVSPLLGVMNLIALSTGLFLKPRDMWQSFLLGCRSCNLYSVNMREAVDTDKWADLDALKQALLNVRPLPRFLFLRRIEFCFYCGAAVGIHAMLAIPASFARFFTDVMMGQTVFQAVRAKPRTDLY